MEIQACSEGLRVVSKETGKVATIKRVLLDKGEVDIEYDNGMTARVHTRIIEPASADESSDGVPAATVPMRPCPQCATRMPVAATTCPSCGFQYGVKKPSGMPGIVKLLLAIIVLAGIAFVVWKFVY